MSILSLRPTYVYLPPVSLHNYHPLVVVSWTQQPNHLNTTTSTPTLPCICLSVCPRGERERERVREAMALHHTSTDNNTPTLAPTAAYRPVIWQISHYSWKE